MGHCSLFTDADCFAIVGYRNKFIYFAGGKLSGGQLTIAVPAVNEQEVSEDAGGNVTVISPGRTSLSMTMPVVSLQEKGSTTLTPGRPSLSVSGSGFQAVTTSTTVTTEKAKVKRKL